MKKIASIIAWILILGGIYIFLTTMGASDNGAIGVLQIFEGTAISWSIFLLGCGIKKAIGRN